MQGRQTAPAAPAWPWRLRERLLQTLPPGWQLVFLLRLNCIVTLFSCAGASDCASCTGVALEVARALVADPAARLAAPAIFLLNGGEETFCQGAAGFMQNGTWRDTAGAFINLESTGSGGPAIVFQATGKTQLTSC